MIQDTSARVVAGLLDLEIPKLDLTAFQPATTPSSMGRYRNSGTNETSRVLTPAPVDKAQREAEGFVFSTVGSDTYYKPGVKR